jgi:hypothetical protein
LSLKEGGLSSSCRTGLLAAANQAVHPNRVSQFPPPQIDCQGRLAPVADLHLSPQTMTTFQHRLSFTVLVILVFIVENLVASGWVSTGPHVYVDLAFGWLQLHRYGKIWSIDYFDFQMLIVAVLIPVLLTCLVSKQLGHKRLTKSIQSTPR